MMKKIYPSNLNTEGLRGLNDLLGSSSEGARRLGIHGFTSHEIALFIVTTVTTSDSN
jgi:hypothetical protein